MRELFEGDQVDEVPVVRFESNPIKTMLVGGVACWDESLRVPPFRLVDQLLTLTTNIPTTNQPTGGVQCPDPRGAPPPRPTLPRRSVRPLFF